MARCPNHSLAIVSVLLITSAALAQTSDNRFVIVLIGPTGSGKTTQSEFLKRKFGIPAISADDLAAGNRASPALNRLIRDRLSKMDLAKGVVLNGYPATRDQADHLAATVKELGLPSPIVIQLDVPDQVVRERLQKRKGKDDTPELIDQRLKLYHRELEMIRNYYPEANIWTIDGTRTAPDVSKTIEAILRDEMPRKR